MLMSILYLAVCEDGSLLIAHSSPPGVKISGTYDQNGNSNPRAVGYAQKIMKRIIQTGTVVIQIALSILVLPNQVMYLYFTGIQKH